MLFCLPLGITSDLIIIQMYHSELLWCMNYVRVQLCTVQSSESLISRNNIEPTKGEILPWCLNWLTSRTCCHSFPVNWERKKGMIKSLSVSIRWKSIHNSWINGYSSHNYRKHHWALTGQWQAVWLLFPWITGLSMKININHP